LTKSKEMLMKTILLVEDSETIALGLKYALQQERYNVTVAKCVSEAKGKIDNSQIDLAILDVSLPDGNGLELCKYIKEKQDLPIIFLTAKDEENDIIAGLDLGADDYITKPFRVRELISRISTVMRRYNKTEGNNNSDVIKIGNIQLNMQNAQVTKDGKEIVFTSLEYKILLLLFSNPNKIITRDMILDKVWDIAGNFVNDNTLTVYIKRIREKLDDNDGEIIKTVRGMGYKISTN